MSVRAGFSQSGFTQSREGAKRGKLQLRAMKGEGFVNNKELTPSLSLAVAFRYPGDYIEPELEEYQEAFSAAQEIYDFVADLLPERLNE